MSLWLGRLMVQTLPTSSTLNKLFHSILTMMTTTMLIMTMMMMTMMMDINGRDLRKNACVDGEPSKRFNESGGFEYFKSH